MTTLPVEGTLPTPAPPVNNDTLEFWAATLDGRLLIRRCRSCGAAIWYPRPICPFCHGSDTVWEEASGQGTIYSFTIVHQSGGAWSAATPYVLAYVELAEGPRMMTNIVDVDPETVAIGQAVDVIFYRTEEASALVRFRPVAPPVAE